MKAFYDSTIEMNLAGDVTTFTLSDFGRTFQPAGSAVQSSDLIMRGETITLLWEDRFSAGTFTVFLAGTARFSQRCSSAAPMTRITAADGFRRRLSISTPRR